MSDTDPPENHSELDADALVKLLDAECEYQATRADLGDAEEHRYRQLYDAYLSAGKDSRVLLGAVPRSITRASLAAALRRHAPAGDWLVD